jgi:hypothetical protein
MANVVGTPQCRRIAMKVLTSVNPDMIADKACLAESNEFAIYRLDNDTFALVQRHKGVDWQGITLSGDGLFRVSELIAKATRTLYRDLASRQRS